MELSAKLVGDRIREIRRRQNLTQVELARKLDMRPGPVNCIETGKNFPSAKVLHKLSIVLNVSIDALFSTTDPVNNRLLKESGIRYQTKSADSAPYIVNSEIQALGSHAVLIRNGDEINQIDFETTTVLSELTDAVLALEDICGVQKCADIPLYIPFSFTVDGIESLVHHVRCFLGINDAVIYDYIELLENSGLRILFCKMSENIESISCYDEENSNAFIFVQTSINIERQLFRLFYELGRIYRYTQKKYGENANTDSVTYIRRGKLLTDHRAARLFAALFIQPAKSISSSVAQLGVAPDEWTWELILRIKHRFGVSAETFIYRLAELKLMNVELENIFRKKIHDYYKTNNFSEPSQSRRMLIPNGRVGDLLLCAKELHHSEEINAIEETLSKYGCKV